MGFSSYHNSTKNPAQRFYKWSGGIKKQVELPNGGTAEQIEGGLTYYDSTLPEGEQNVRVPLPFNFCVLEQSRSITGFSPTPGTSIRYFSNEAVSFDDVFVVMRKDDSGTKEILRGTYEQIKEKLPQGARLQINLYIYNPETSQIERLNCQGSALAAFIEMSKKKKNAIYEQMATLQSSGELKKNGTVSYMPPVFSLSGTQYTEEEMKLLVAKDKEVTDYLNWRHNENVNSNGGQSGQVTGEFDQTPRAYQGEESQETVEEDTAAVIGADEIPF